MIEGAAPTAMRWVPEEERAVTEKQTAFWIKPKTGHEANQTLASYAGAGRDGRNGYRELSVRKLDNADVEQFLDIVEKVEWYLFSKRFPELREQGGFESIVDEATLSKVALDLSSDNLIEVFEASSNMQRLMAGAKKGLPSPSTFPSGSQSTQEDNKTTTAKPA